MSFLHAVKRRIPSIRARARLRARVRSDAGMSTAEYAVGTLAAVAFALLLFKIVNSAPVGSALSGVITRALNTTF